MSTKIKIVKSPTKAAPSVGHSLLTPPFGAGLMTRRFRVPGETPAAGDCDVAILQSAYRTAVDHLKEDTTRELGGLLVGLDMPAPGGGRCVLVVHALPGLYTEGTPTSLTLSKDTWAEFDRITEFYKSSGLALRRVGWYHSHPRIHIFLSRWDLDVCRDFDRPTDLALVIDPVLNKGAMFVRGAKGYRSDSPQGFIELCDVQADTVVTWTNVEEVTGPPTPVPGPGPGPVIGPEPSPGPTVIVSGPPPAPRRWPLVAAGAALAASVGWGLTWFELQKTTTRADTATAQVGTLQTQVTKAETDRGIAIVQAKTAELGKQDAVIAQRNAEQKADEALARVALATQEQAEAKKVDDEVELRLDAILKDLRSKKKPLGPRQ